MITPGRTQEADLERVQENGFVIPARVKYVNYPYQNI